MSKVVLGSSMAEPKDGLSEGQDIQFSEGQEKHIFGLMGMRRHTTNSRGLSNGLKVSG